MSVRAKFQFTGKKQSYCDEGATLVFEARYDATVPEDQRFSKFTPTGRFEAHVTNPAALAQFTLGQFYYLDITPVPAGDPA